MTKFLIAPKNLVELASEVMPV